MPGSGYAAASAGCRRIETRWSARRHSCAPPSTSPASTRTRSAAASCSLRRARWPRLPAWKSTCGLVAVAGLPHAVRHNMNVTFHCFADEANAQVRLLQPGDLRPGDSGWAQIKLGTPVAVVRGDRFVLHTPNDTIAGGVIADVAPKRHRRGDAAMIAALEVLLSGSPSDAVLAAVGRRPLIDRATLTSASRSRAPISTQHSPNSSTRARSCCWAMAPARAPSPDAFDRLRSGSDGHTGAFHREHPLRPGMPLEELRSRLGLNAEAFQLVAGVLRGVTVSGATASLATFRPSQRGHNSNRSLRTWQRSRAFARRYGRGLRAGTPGVSRRDRRRRRCGRRRPVRSRLVRRDDRKYPDAHRAARRNHALAQTRDLIGTSRKYAQALLDISDRLRVTRRVGDERACRG